MSQIRYVGRERSISEARAFYIAGRTADSLAALGHAPSCESAILRARCLLRGGDSSGALNSLQAADLVGASRGLATEYHALLGSVLAENGRPEDGSRHIALAQRAAELLGGAAALDAALHGAAAASMRGDERAVLRIVVTALAVQPLTHDRYPMAFGVARAQLLEVQSLVSTGRDDPAAQAALLLEAWDTLSHVERLNREVWVQASLLRAVAPLVCDLQLEGTDDILRCALTSVAWTPEVASAHFAVQRAVAWNEALGGDHFAAFARMRNCIDFAPSAPLRVAAMLDRAYLASEMQQEVILCEEMMRAGDMTRSVDWKGVPAEETRVLLDVARAYARDDATLARCWLDVYDRRVVPTSHDAAGTSFESRIGAAEDDVRGEVLAAEGHDVEGIAMLRRALETWVHLGCGWRAARTALAIVRLTGAIDDASAARQHARPFGRSWLARRVRRMRHAASPRRSRAAAP